MPPAGKIKFRGGPAAEVEEVEGTGGGWDRNRGLESRIE